MNFSYSEVARDLLAALALPVGTVNVSTRRDRKGERVMVVSHSPGTIFGVVQPLVFQTVPVVYEVRKPVRAYA